MIKRSAGTVNEGTREPFACERISVTIDSTSCRRSEFLWCAVTGLTRQRAAGRFLQPAYVPENVECEKRSGEGERHHWNVNRVAVKSVGGGINAGRGRKRAQADPNTRSPDIDQAEQV